MNQARLLFENISFVLSGAPVRISDVSSMPLPNILLCTLMVLRILKGVRILTRRWAITFRREYFGGAYCQEAETERTRISRGKRGKRHLGIARKRRLFQVFGLPGHTHWSWRGRHGSALRNAHVEDVMDCDFTIKWEWPWRRQHVPNTSGQSQPSSSAAARVKGKSWSGVRTDAAVPPARLKRAGRYEHDEWAASTQLAPAVTILREGAAATARAQGATE